MQRVVIYARVSTEEEEQASALKNQILMLEDYISSQEDWVLIDSFVDNGRSGTTIKGRKEYTRLYNELLEDNFDIVAIKDETRLNRNPLNWYLFIDRLLKNNKKLYFLNTQSFYSADDEFIMGIKAGMASNYSRELSKKLNMAHQQRMKKGTVCTNGKIWGYNQKNGQLSIDEKQAEIVRYVFERYSNGIGFRKIQQELNRKGIKNQNNKEFSMTTLKRMIKNPKYKGTLICNQRHLDFNTKKIIEMDEKDWFVHENVIPKIINEQTWNKANEHLNAKRRYYFNTDDKKEIKGLFKGSYLYSNFIFCDKCGVSYWHRQNHGSRKLNVWCCGNYCKYGNVEKTPGGCTPYYIRNEIIDDIVKDVIFKFWTNKEKNLKNVVDALDKVLENNNYNSTIEKLTKDKLKLMQKNESLIDLYADALISKEEFKNKKQNYDSDIKIINEQIELFEGKNKTVLNKKQRLVKIQEFLDKKILDKDSISEEIIKNFLNKIVVKTKNEFEIYLNGNFKYIAQKLDDAEYTVQNVTNAMKHWLQNETYKFDGKGLYDRDFSVSINIFLEL